MVVKPSIALEMKRFPVRIGRTAKTTVMTTGDEKAGPRELKGRRQALLHQGGHGEAAEVRGAEVSDEHAGDPLEVLNEHGLVEAEAVTQGIEGVLGHAVGAADPRDGRVSRQQSQDEEDHERDDRDHQQGRPQTRCDVSDHWGSSRQNWCTPRNERGVHQMRYFVKRAPSTCVVPLGSTQTPVRFGSGRGMPARC